jgi:hypothetical protein
MCLMAVVEVLMALPVAEVQNLVGCWCCVVLIAGAEVWMALAGGGGLVQRQQKMKAPHNLHHHCETKEEEKL